MPLRGNIEKIGVRTDAKPESRPPQNGELADRPSNTGRSQRSPSSARIADSASGTATWTCCAIVGSRWASARIVASISRRRSPPETSASERATSGCRPITAARRPSSWRSVPSTAARSSPSSRAAPATVPCGPVRSSSTHACVSRAVRTATSPGSASRTSSTRLATDQSHGSSRISSSSIPTVHGQAAPASAHCDHAAGGMLRLALMARSSPPCAAAAMGPTGVPAHMPARLAGPVPAISVLRWWPQSA